MRPDENELLAYVDGQLAPDRRRAVEQALGRHPELAARVMADLALRQAFAEAVRPLEPVDARTRLAAERLSRGVARPALPRWAQMAASGLLLVGAGWVGHAAIGTGGDAEAGTLPPVVQDAIQAQRVAQVRAGLSSQTESTDFDSAELTAETGLLLPAMPAGWTVRDIQVFPSDNGPSVEVALVDDGDTPLFLYAAPAARFGASQPVPAATEIGDVVFWQVGETVYALSAGTPAADLTHQAERLVSSLY